MLQGRLDLISPIHFFLFFYYCKSLLKREAHTHQKRWTQWHETSYLDMVSLWVWKPIFPVFAQHSVSFRGQNHIMESRSVTAGHFCEGPGNEWDTFPSSAFPQIKLSITQANVQTWQADFGNVSVYRLRCSRSSSSSSGSPRVGSHLGCRNALEQIRLTLLPAAGFLRNTWRHAT